MGGVSWYKVVVYILLSANGRAYFCKSIAIEMGGVSRYFSKVSGSGVDSTPLMKASSEVWNFCAFAAFEFRFQLLRTLPLRAQRLKNSRSPSGIVVFKQDLPAPKSQTIASDFRVDWAKSPEIPQKEGVSGSEIAAWDRKSLATFHRTLKLQCSIALCCLGNR